MNFVPTSAQLLLRNGLQRFRDFALKIAFAHNFGVSWDANDVRQTVEAGRRVLDILYRDQHIQGGYVASIKLFVRPCILVEKRIHWEMIKSIMRKV